MQLIKGESAYWINKQKSIKNKFEWADEYFAVSVSESMLDKVRAYIDGQEEHPKLKTAKVIQGLTKTSSNDFSYQ